MKKTVALLGIHHESNTFIRQPTTLEDFIQGHFLRGADIISEYQDAFHEIGGMLEVMEREAVTVVPVLYAEANPGGIIEAEAYEAILCEMMEGLKRILPVDGCLVAPHGAAVSEGHSDMDGHWLAVLRQAVGDIPIVGTLDPHANVSPAMVECTDGLFAYKTNPHTDQRDTGKAAAGLMVSLLRSKSRPVQVLLQMPLAISIEQQKTDAEPCKSLFAQAALYQQRPGVLSLSVLLGFPYADVQEMGTAVIVIADHDREAALQTGQSLVQYVVERKHAFNGIKAGIPDGTFLSRCKKPVLLLDMGDNVGAGAPGNSTVLLEALERQGQHRSFVCIWDPGAVLCAATHECGEIFTLSFGASLSPGALYEGPVRLVTIREGKFKELHPRHGGQVHFDMGLTAVVITKGGNTVMLTTLRTMPFSLQQLLSFDLDPAGFEVIVAKGVNAPLAAYGPVSGTVVQVNTPGVTGADMTLFNYRNRRKPMFPFEDLLPDHVYNSAFIR